MSHEPDCGGVLPLSRSLPAVALKTISFDNIPVSLYNFLMKTTIDFPEIILHRAKTVALQRKITLKELVIQGVEQAIREPVGDPETERRGTGRRSDCFAFTGKKHRTHRSLEPG
jgi:hypothetical protein